MNVQFRILFTSKLSKINHKLSKDPIRLILKVKSAENLLGIRMIIVRKKMMWFNFLIIYKV